MLRSLTIQDLAVVERLSLVLQSGLSALTGETGAGKSILLDGLGLALGQRADASMVRGGARQATVTAVFEPPADHPVRALLAEQSLPDEPELVLRRVVGADGRGRAFVNDTSVSVALLRQAGDLLVEVHGQHDIRGLLDPGRHRALLDTYAGLSDALETCRAAWRERRAAHDAVAAAEAALAAARTEEEYLRHAVAELDAVAPAAGEEAALAEERTLLQQSERLAEGLREALAALGGDDGAEARLRGAERALERLLGHAGEAFEAPLQAVARAASETMEAVAVLEETADKLDRAPHRLEKVEERLFGLRQLARKHRVSCDGLVELHASLAARLAALDRGDGELATLRQAAERADVAYRAAADMLAKRRRAAATKLDKAVAKEIPDLRLGDARFETVVEAGEDGPEGADRVRFTVATTPGMPAGPLDKVASGGELSRLMLALKVALAETRGAPTLVFDEVDAGVGGAVADKVGERLAKLAATTQVLVVTHSPQVAARGDHHWRVLKLGGSDSVATIAEALDAGGRREEIARMLAGAEVTREARAAARSLLQGGRG
jgi:DNA repair protein RecN (Recombination protein N)